MNEPLVSTVIPVFNGERFLAEAIESALAQDYERHEVIVVNDGSTDATADVIAGFEQIRAIDQPNGGTGAARNAGIAVASGELVCLLDADDVMLPERIARQVAQLRERPRIGGVLGRQELLVEDGAPLPHWVEAEPAAPRSGELAGDYFPLATLMARGSVFERVGAFQAEMTGDEVDWFLRAREHGVEFATLDQALIRRRVHATNATHDRVRARDGVFRALKARIDRGRAGRGDGEGTEKRLP